MEMREDQKPTQILPKPVRYAIGIWFLLGCVPVFSKMFGYDFLPSSEWAASARVPGIAIGAASAVLLLWAVIKGIDTVPGGKFKKALGIIGAPLFGFFLGQDAVVITGPMLIATVAGHETEISLTIESADRSGSRRCRSPLEFEGLPFMFDTVCGVPDDFRQRLAPGKHIAVIGRGTSYGVFAESARTLD